MTPPRGLASANGVRLGPDGKLYVVSAFGGEVVRIEIESGELEIVSPRGSGIATPDDLAFDSAGVLYVTECMDARVSALEDGQTRVVSDNLPGANGLTIFEDRIFVTECRPTGRLLEVFADGREPIVMAEDLELPNGMCVGPDRLIYFVLVYSGQILRVSVDGGEPELFVDGLAVPSSVRLGPDGLIWVSQGHTGEVTKIDPETRQMTTVAKTRPGIDNLDISADGRLFLSYYIDGQVVEVLDDGELRELVPAGLLAPYGIATLDDLVYVADGMKIATFGADRVVEPGAKYTDEGFPGYLIDLAAGPSGLFASVSAGAVSRFDPAAVTSEVIVEGLEEARGIALRPDGMLVVAEGAAGRVVEVDADGTLRTVVESLGRPAGVAIAADGACWVSDEARGELIRVDGDGTAAVVLDGLRQPQGVAAFGDQVFVLEAGAGDLLAVSAAGGESTKIASGLPTGSGEGGVASALGGMPELIPGPLAPFAGLAADSAGRLYVCGDAIGSVLVLEHADQPSTREEFA